MHQATNELEKIRRQVWQEMRKLPDQHTARRLKGAHWAVPKNPGGLSDGRAATLRKLKRQEW